MIRSRAIVVVFLWLVVLGAGVLYPFFTLFHAGFSISLLFAPEVLRTAERTAVTSLSALVVAFLISFPLARRIRGTAEGVLQFLWILPSFLYALFVIVLFRQFRQFDPLFELYSMRTVWVAWVLVAIPFLSVSLARAWRDLDPREDEMMRVLGANRWQRWIRYEIPKMAPTIRSALLHQMWLYLTSFTLVVILGGGPPNETLEVGVYSSVRLDEWNVARALAFSIWQGLLLVVLRLALSRSRSSEMTVGLEWARRGASGSRGLHCGRWVLGALVLMIAWLVGTTSGLSAALFSGVTLSLAVAVISLCFSVLVFELKQPLLAEIGAWLSPMVFALAWWKAYAFSASPWLLCIGIQVVLFSPWVARTFFPLLARARVAELEAVRSLGSHPLRAWFHVEWPRIRESAFGLFALIFGLSLSEVSAVILFSRGSFEPLPVWIQNQLSRFQFGPAFAGTLALLCVSGFVFLAPFLLQGRHGDSDENNENDPGLPNLSG